MSHDAFATWIGSIGVALLLLAFALNLSRQLRSDARLYTTLNLVGAGLACYSSWRIDFMPFVVLEGVWALVALAAVTRSIFARGSAAR